jgi:hypothetical protein
MRMIRIQTDADVPAVRFFFRSNSKQQFGIDPAALGTNNRRRRFVAERLADFLQLPPATAPTSPSIIEKEIVARGDIAAMLKLTRADKFFPAEQVTI